MKNIVNWKHGWTQLQVFLNTGRVTKQCGKFKNDIAKIPISLESSVPRVQKHLYIACWGQLWKPQKRKFEEFRSIWAKKEQVQYSRAYCYCSKGVFSSSGFMNKKHVLETVELYYLMLKFL